MNQIIEFLQKRVSLSLIFYLILIYVIMNSVLQGLELVIRGISADVLRLTIILGIIVGWLLGRSSIKVWKVFLISLTTGFIYTSIHISSLDSAVGDLIRFSLRNLGRILFQRSENEIEELNYYLGILQAKFGEVLVNLTIWFKDLVSGFGIYNQISTLLSWGFILWLLGSWISWITRRKDQPIWGVIPAGTLLSVLMTYTIQRRVLLVILLGAGLILIGMINLETKLRVWKRDQIKGAENVKERMAFTIIAFSLYTMIFAGIVPSVRINAIADPFEKWLYGDDQTGYELEDPSIESGGGFDPNIYSGDQFSGLPRAKLIGSGPELAETVVMIIKYPTIPSADSNLPNSATYWRSFTYDQYTGSGWRTSPTVEDEYKPGQEIRGFQSEKQEIITQEVRLSKSLRKTLFSAGTPLTIDQNAQVFWRVLLDETTYGIDQSVIQDDLFAVTLENRVYQVRSQIPVADDNDLRSTGDEIPEWISVRYLYLPETVPSRVHDLAVEIVANQPTPYDRAKALETFLRSYPYTLDLPEPPLDRDIVDYFLFELQTGYCDYYATSMVVLARSVGLPARIVVGYAGGQYDEEYDHYLVSEADAHSWVEIYFPKIGWIPFEPTAARSLINQEELSLPLPPELEKLPRKSIININIDFPIWETGLGIILFLVFLVLISDLVDQSRLNRMDSKALSLELINRLYRYGRWLQLGHMRSDTIYEFKDRINAKLASLAEATQQEESLLICIPRIEQLTEYAVTVNYSTKPLESRHTKDLLEIWKDIRVHLRKVIWLEMVRRAKRRLKIPGIRFIRRK